MIATESIVRAEATDPAWVRGILEWADRRGWTLSATDRGWELSDRHGAIVVSAPCSHGASRAVALEHLARIRIVLEGAPTQAPAS